MKAHFIAAIAGVTSMMIQGGLSEKQLQYNSTMDYPLGSSLHDHLMRSCERLSKREKSWIRGFRGNIPDCNYHIPEIRWIHTALEAVYRDWKERNPQTTKRDLGDVSKVSDRPSEKDLLTQIQSPLYAQEPEFKALNKGGTVSETIDQVSLAEAETHLETSQNLVPEVKATSEEGNDDDELVGLLTFLQVHLRLLKRNLQNCFHGDHLNIGHYILAKYQVKEFFADLQSSDIPEKVVDQVQDKMDEILLMSDSMNKVAIWLCVEGEGSFEQCTHFSFEAYLRKVRDINKKTEWVLMEVLFSTIFNTTLVEEVEIQKARLNEVQIIETERWKGIPEYDSLEKMKDDIALMLENLEIVLTSRKHKSGFDPARKSYS